MWVCRAQSGKKMGYEFLVPCLFGLEGIVADELRYMKMENVRAENGRVLFCGGEEELARANLRLRCGERVLIRLAAFEAPTFDALFERVRALPWEAFIAREEAFPVKGHSLASKLHSVPDCQKIIKKAIVERMKEKYGLQWCEETGERVQVQFSIMKDMAEILIDTTGAGLHKRGYRLIANEAPLRETLAAAMVKLSRFRGRDEFIDPMCGSGTIPIEAAMIAQDRAPGLYRRFSAERWARSDRDLWERERDACRAMIRTGDFVIRGCDVDEKSIALAADNAKRAGVAGLLRLKSCDALKLPYEKLSGVLVTNPPYGERMLDAQRARALYRAFGKALCKNPALKRYIICSDPEFETYFGARADKKRKLYNGMIKCNLFMYYQ